MATRWKNYSYSASSKIIAFLLVIICYSILLTAFIDTAVFHNVDFNAAGEKNYYQSTEFNHLSNEIVENITAILQYKDEEHNLGGGSPGSGEIGLEQLYKDFKVSKVHKLELGAKEEEDVLEGGLRESGEISQAEEQLYKEFLASMHYNPDLGEAKNREIFQEIYVDQIQRVKEQLIQEDLHIYQDTVKRINAYDGLIYYAQRGENVFASSPEQSREYFTHQPAYMIFEGFKTEMFPEQGIYFHATGKIEAGDIIYIAFTDEFLSPRIAAWQANRDLAMNRIYGLAVLAVTLAAAFIFLLFITGRKPGSEQIYMNPSVDKIYTDLNLGVCLLLIATWIGSMSLFFRSGFRPLEFIFAITLVIAAAGLVMVLSLVKHIKNRSFFTHSLAYYIWSKAFIFMKDVFNSGSTAVKVILIVVFYPIIAGLSFFMMPIVIVVAAWLAMQKVKEYSAVKEGIKAVKEGDLNYKIDISGEGEFAALARNINSITDGLNKAVENEIKSERLKSELITNVSHDIRTPLTSIITYVDLLKTERDPHKIAEYVQVLDQKGQRLKNLTDDLFEAAKASSGNIPVNLEIIDLLALLTQGLGEFDEQIKERNLEFKLNCLEEKLSVQADGRLLWRALENLLLNILKYAQPGSRVYIDVVKEGADVILTIKNISAYELNISASELMERFTRGDVARGSTGSGLGLSIAQSLIEIQGGDFGVEIDGDLFKAIIRMGRGEEG